MRKGIFDLDDSVIEQAIANFHIDRQFLPQDGLDVVSRQRTSVYPWRGQFSPDLVGLLLDALAVEGSVILDPFVGSGTTLFEANVRGLSAYGIEINPAAILLSNMAEFGNTTLFDRQTVMKMAEALLEKTLAPYLPVSLFNSMGNSKPSGKGMELEVLELLQRVESNPLVHQLLSISVMLAMGDSDILEPQAAMHAFYKNCAIVRDLAFNTQPCKVIFGDARNLPISADTIDLVVTSPPYINVFNYHQNFRKALEMMGWRLLDVAPSEIGANRKHRGNRFMTVIQYCMDMSQVFDEIRRVLDNDGLAVFVIGRESRVRGVPYYNGQLLALISTIACGYKLLRWQERKFTNRFGKLIFEDILTLSPAAAHPESREIARAIGRWALSESLRTAATDVRVDIEVALERSMEISPSPLLTRQGKTSVPLLAHFS